MKYSIRRQFALIFIGLMAGTILLCWFINNVFLEEYYIHNKTKIIKNAYSFICDASNHDSYGTQEFVEELNNICNVSNLAVCVMDANSQTKYESSNGGRELEKQLIAYIFGLQQGEGRELEQKKDYILQVVPFRDTEYLMMFGKLDSGISFILRTPLESIRESVAVANRFLGYVGMAAAIGGGIIIWLVSGRITKPIQSLNHISERMVSLDFEAKYEGKSHNEIGMLGENINKLSDSLEKSISELKTANNQLKRDIRKKEEIDEMRKEFLANVSHELKTPIALIQGYAEGLTEGISEDPESRKFYCDVISDEAAKMNQMVQKLLTLNQLEFGNNTLNLERFDLTALIGNYIQSAGILIEKNEIQVQVEKTGAIYAWGDEFAVEEVFANYFTNAVNHCSGDKQIVVKFQERENKVRVSVFNTGDSIPEEALSRLWEKFYKVDKARTREYGGSGVGLSIVKAIMESMHQEYGVENYANGVLFWFELERA